MEANQFCVQNVDKCGPGGVLFLTSVQEVRTIEAMNR